MTKFGFDTSEVEVSAPADYSPFPKGEYQLHALEAEEKDTSKKNGTYIKVKFEVVSGPHTGRLMWVNFNINNPSDAAQRIGRQQLVAWATACGKPDATDTDTLLGKSFLANVDIQKGSDGYEDSNTIKSYLMSKKASATSAPKPTEKPTTQVEVVSETPKGANPWD